MEFEVSDLIIKSDKQENLCVVKVITNVYSNHQGVHIKKSLIFLRRKCKGFNVLEEECSGIGADEVVPRIINLDECNDGIYEIITCNESHDWETGYIDDYDFKLIPFKEENHD